MKLFMVATVGSVLVGVMGVQRSFGAEDTDNTDIIKQLQKRIDELEKKVKNLETKQGVGTKTNQAESQRRIEELDQKIKVMDRNRELEEEEQAERRMALPTVSLGYNGLIVRSADSNFLMNIHGYAQADARFYLGGNNPADDTFLLRRVRPIIEATVY